MATLFLIRHGEPELRGVFLGQLDVPLSSCGRRNLESDLSQVQVAVVWHSTLLRATQTAEYVQARHRFALAGLREIDYGTWTGKTWAAIEAECGEQARQKCEDWLNVPAPGGECWADFRKRVEAAWQIIRRGPTPAAVVAHQAVNAALMSVIGGGDPLAFQQDFGEIIRVEYDSASDR